MIGCTTYLQKKKKEKKKQTYSMQINTLKELLTLFKCLIWCNPDITVLATTGSTCITQSVYLKFFGNNNSLR